MGQFEIINYLKKHSSKEKPKTRKEIDKALKISSSASLKRLREHGEVFFKKIKSNGGGDYYIYWTK